MNVIEVGKPYSAARATWPEGVDYNYRAGLHEWRQFMDRPTPREIEDITRGPARFALAVSDEVIFLCSKFGTQPWSDGTFSIHLVPEDERQLPPPPNAREGAVLHVILVDTTNIVRGLRIVTFSPSFTAALHRAIRVQAELPFHSADYDDQIARIYSSYSSEAIATRLAFYRCKGGEHGTYHPDTH